VEGKLQIQKQARAWTRYGAMVGAAVLLGAAFGTVRNAVAEVCTTQAKMEPAQREALAAAAMALASAVQAGDTAKVRANTVAEYAADFTASEYLIRSTAAKLAGERLRVTSLYGLDATARKKDATGDAEFACPLTATTLETDFNIPGLPPGNYAFAMVEAEGGAQPFLLSFLLRQDAGVWKMAGFYPRARTAAGHDGLWYWNEARAAAKAKEPWAAWLLYSEASNLLRPANFVASTHLESLGNEQRAAAPPELSNGVSNETPLVLKGAAGAEFHFTGMSSERSDDGTRVNIMLHMRAGTTDAAAAKARADAAATAFVAAHPEVRKDFQTVWVFAETDAQQPLAMSQQDIKRNP
jgi:hypothetical protein